MWNASRKNQMLPMRKTQDSACHETTRERKRRGV